MAVPLSSEMENWKAAMHRECDRYELDKENVAAVVAGKSAGPTISIRAAGGRF